VNDRSSPVQVGTDTDWSTAWLSNNTSYCVKTNGTLWVWGYNYNGKLGLNQPAPTRYSSPTQVPGTWSTDVRKLRSSNYHSIAIKSDNTLWGWGSNQYGQLGQNTAGEGGGTLRFSSPTQIPGTNWNSCIAGYFFSAGTKTDGTLWTWGDNSSGGLANNQPAPARSSSPTQVPGSWSKVVGGYTSVFGIKTDGTLWNWGYTTALNVYGPASRFSSPVQVGTNTTWSDLTGSGSFMATKTDGTLWAWGTNEAGQNAQNDRGGYDGLWGPLLSRSSPTQIPGGWVISGVNMSGGPGGRQLGALKS